MTDENRVVRYELFNGSFSRWSTVFAQAAEYANRIGPERLINISHSQDGTVAVWYWSSDSVR